MNRIRPLGFPMLVLFSLVSLQAAAAECALPSSGFGVFVAAMANVVKTAPRVEVICWLQQLQADGKGHVTGGGPTANFDAYYSYLVGADHISVSSEVSGVKETQFGGGSAGANVNVVWMDTLTPHSATMKAPGKGISDKDVISLRIRLLQDSARCRGNAGNFWYNSVAGVNVVSAVTEANTGGETFIGSTNRAGGTLANRCPLSTSESGVAGILIGFPFKISIAVQVAASGSVAYEHSDSGDVSAGRGGVRICFEHPKTPEDLTLASASGASYWCD